LALQTYGSLRLEEDPNVQPATLSGYLRSSRGLWYWLTIGLAAATTLAVFTVPEGLYLLVYARYTLGSIFVLWLPGYSFIKALFPTRVPVPTGEKELDGIERAALSVGMSLALVPIAGLLLNYTPWGIRVTPVTLSLLGLTVAFATAALLRETAATEEELGREAWFPTSSPRSPTSSPASPTVDAIWLRFVEGFRTPKGESG